jgi:formylglycine-generating enzyme required for sulfatase activity
MYQNFKNRHLALCLICIAFTAACAQVSEVTDQPIEEQQVDIEAYTEQIPGSNFGMDMIPVTGGTFYPGDASNGTNRFAAEISPFWMGKYEITWDFYELYLLSDQFNHVDERFDAALADAVTMPSLPYIDPVSGMERGNHPVINVTQFAALSFTRWLTLKTGHFYRLPTEAEWEYACRAGSESRYYFGDNPDELDRYAWFSENSGNQYHEVGTKQPNAWGLYDMLGNVAEWALDQYVPNLADVFNESEQVIDPWTKPTSLEPRVVRGGSWNHKAEEVSCTSRIQSDPGGWKRDDPQIPQSIWWNTNAPFVGFRVVRPLNQPTQEEMEAFWELTLDQFYYE